MSEKLTADAGRPDYTEPVKPISDMRKYKCLTGHLICESLGYFTPRSALRAILAHRDGEPFACEWYSHMAMCQGKVMFDHETLIEINRATIERAFHGRRGHAGYMAEYKRAKALVDQEIADEGSTGGMLASWF
jgi:hypothetical protein